MGLPNVLPFIPEILLALGIVESHCPYPCSFDEKGMLMCIHADVSSISIHRHYDKYQDFC